PTRRRDRCRDVQIAWFHLTARAEENRDVPGLPRVPAMQRTIGFIMHIPSTVRRADLPVPHAFLPHARVYPALSSSCVARLPATITDSASRKTPQAPGTVPALVEEQAVKSRLFDLPSARA